MAALPIVGDGRGTNGAVCEYLKRAGRQAGRGLRKTPWKAAFPTGRTTPAGKPASIARRMGQLTASRTRTMPAA